jgi:subfamily B ATP-binding cassette protein MsbA
MAALTAVVWFGGQQVLSGALTPGELVAFIFYMFMVAGPLAEFAGLYAQVREAMGASHRFFAIIATAPEADRRLWRRRCAHAAAGARRGALPRRELSL